MISPEETKNQVETWLKRRPLVFYSLCIKLKSHSLDYQTVNFNLKGFNFKKKKDHTLKGSFIDTARPNTVDDTDSPIQR